MAEFIGLSHLVPWSDSVLKTLFWLGLNDNLVDQVPTAANSYPLAQYIDCVMLQCGSSLTVGNVDETVSPESPAAAKSSPPFAGRLSPPPFAPHSLPPFAANASPPPSTAHSRPPLSAVKSKPPPSTAPSSPPSTALSSPSAVHVAKPSGVFD